MSAQAVTNSIKIPSDVKHIRDVSQKIVALLVERNINKSIIFDVRLSLEESILNAIEHGNKKKRSLTIDISFAIDDGKIKIAVEDKGKGFKHKCLPDPTKDENILRTHGRGVYLIHKLTDKVEYNNKGNRISFTKYFK